MTLNAHSLYLGVASLAPQAPNGVQPVRPGGRR